MYQLLRVTSNSSLTSGIGRTNRKDEIDAIMKDLHEANYPVNLQKRKEEKKWELTEEQTRLLGQLRAKAASKDIPIILCFDSENHGYLSLTRPDSKLFINFVVGEDRRDGLDDAIMYAICQIDQVKSVDTDQQQLDDLTESTRVRCQMNYDRAMSEAVQQVSDLKDLKN